MDTNTTSPYVTPNPSASTLAEHLAYLINRDGIDKLPPVWREVYATRNDAPLAAGQLREMIAYF